MTETALDRASQVWGGVAVQHNDAPKPKDVDKFVFPTSTPTIRETPDYMTRTKSLGHLIDACGEYFNDLHERYKLPFQSALLISFCNYHPSNVPTKQKKGWR